MVTFEELTEQTRAILAEVEDFPPQLLALRKDFYKKYGFGGIFGFGFGNSEITFLNWEINRGVLNPSHHPIQQGSTWWRGVNRTILFESMLASRIHESKETFENLPAPLRLWLAYLQQPNAQTWYRAHNASVVSGYAQFLPAVAQENEEERQFINRVLYLVLYAGTLNESVDILGVSQLLATPALVAVNFAVMLYPQEYPLKGYNPVALYLAEAVILPRLKTLYEYSAKLLQMPILSEWQRDGRAVYGEASL